ncbi:hypothetical protein BC830DRAFT_1079339 [Chytriomyces sp. MP71]|nr:hypothetical protein BC830DRAFT_1079339 [Chytriomyces sp. MP71]
MASLNTQTAPASITQSASVYIYDEFVTLNASKITEQLWDTIQDEVHCTPYSEMEAIEENDITLIEHPLLSQLFHLNNRTGWLLFGSQNKQLMPLETFGWKDIGVGQHGTVSNYGKGRNKDNMAEPTHQTSMMTTGFVAYKFRWGAKYHGDTEEKLIVLYSIKAIGFEDFDGPVDKLSGLVWQRWDVDIGHDDNQQDGAFLTIQ